MLALLSDIIAVMAPVFLIAALGYGWARADLPYSGPFITTFMINVATPCLVFATLLRLRFDAAELATVAGASLACLTLSAAIAFSILRLSGQSLRIYLPALIFPNSGNMGMPLCLFAFGETGLGLAVVFFAVLAVAQFTLGPAIAAGRLDLRADGCARPWSMRWPWPCCSRRSASTCRAGPRTPRGCWATAPCR